VGGLAVAVPAGKAYNLFVNRLGLFAVSSRALPRRSSARWPAKDGSDGWTTRGGGGGGLRGHGELPLNADINVTSLVDVAFVLLIIFMITAPIMQGGVDVRAAQGAGARHRAKAGLVVTVDSDGKIYLDQAALSYDDFESTFPAFVRTKRPTGVYLRADGRVPYATVVAGAAVIRAAGVQDVGLVAEPETINR